MLSFSIAASLGFSVLDVVGTSLYVRKIKMRPSSVSMQTLLNSSVTTFPCKFWRLDLNLVLEKKLKSVNIEQQQISRSYIAEW